MTEHRKKAIFRLTCPLRFHARVFGNGLFANQAFAFLGLPFDLFGLFEKIDKDRNLCP